MPRRTGGHGRHRGLAYGPLLATLNEQRREREGEGVDPSLDENAPSALAPFPSLSEGRDGRGGPR